MVIATRAGSGLAAGELFKESAVALDHAFVLGQHVGLIGVDHDLHQTQDFILAVVG